MFSVMCKRIIAQLMFVKYLFANVDYCERSTKKYFALSTKIVEHNNT